ncbi:hypothetical protein KC19_6G138100 [Ceratodon purpureus]|uniref:Protein kinase domain-containing protein n=1 Tax=Ceratodon purpureus TaxID=3225 RepID=A0A8T0HGG9_CERPU|nr:hypothetical protein KC19_6G138100 [Ceratodon purpureus]
MLEFTLELARLVAPTPETPKTWLESFEKELVNRLCSCKLLDGSELLEFEMGDGWNLCSFLENDIQLGEDLWFLRLFACNSGIQLRNAIDCGRQPLGFPVTADAADSERVPSWRIIKYLCKVANQSERFYRGIYEEQWVRTVSEIRSQYSSEFLVFHSNVVPQQAYFSRMAPCPMNGICPRQGCTGGFFRIGEEDPRSHQYSGKYDFAEQLKPRVQPVRAAEETRYSSKLPTEDHSEELLPLEENEAVHVNTLGSGSQGEVSVILWRRGLFATKQFPRVKGQANPSFNKELEVAKKVLHPNIVHCFRASESLHTYPGFSGLTMELLEDDLEACLVELARTRDLFSFQDSLLVLLQIAEAMKHVHDRNFVHGDLKPGNIFISRLAMPHSYVNSQFYLVKVGDFGCTQHVDTPDAVQSFQFDIGTLYYKAPEVFKYREQQNQQQELQPVLQPTNLKKIDVYSFGVVAYQVLTGLPSTEIGKGKAWQLEEEKHGEGKAKKRRLLNYVFHRFSDHGAPRAFSKVNVMKSDRDVNQWRPSCVVVGDLNDDRARLLPLVTECWSSSPENRPDFTKICETIQTIYNQCFRGCN